MTTATIDQTLRRIVELACRAPSIGNSQPWRWSLAGDGTLELRADRSRRLDRADHLGRQLVLSCGAALHHARVAASALGHPVAVVRPTPGEDPDLMAVLHARPGPTTPGAQAELRALEERRTDRRRFTTWPMAEDRLTRLAQSVATPGVQAVALTDRRARQDVGRLVTRSTGSDLTVFPTDGLLALCSDTDEPEAWLRAGEALSAVWLRATVEGLSMVPVSEVIESEKTRDELAEVVFGGLVHPLLIVRVGWQAIGRPQEPRSPRRPLDDVLAVG
jgi:hypothetical protein